MVRQHRPRNRDGEALVPYQNPALVHPCRHEAACPHGTSGCCGRPDWVCSRSHILEDEGHSAQDITDALDAYIAVADPDEYDENDELQLTTEAIQALRDQINAKGEA